LLRADWEKAARSSAEIEHKLIADMFPALARAGAVVLSDYAKGVLTPRVIRAMIDSARRLGKPVVVDPKGTDYSIYQGATVITPNRKELADATRCTAGTHAEIAAAAAALARSIGSEALLVTLSENGIILQPRDGAFAHVPAYPVKVRDVSGAGDTVVATLGALLAMGADCPQLRDSEVR
jgi:D-beta-D-heptose 7-phosphate kinase/D-beta-D-heptose 1-phosphate adenosyltransferase